MVVVSTTLSSIRAWFACVRVYDEAICAWARWGRMRALGATGLVEASAPTPTTATAAPTAGPRAGRSVTRVGRVSPFAMPTTSSVGQT